MQPIKKLDSLRAIAVLLVVFYHWLPDTHFINIFENGAIGVNIFFTLSGFLISRILLENRSEAERLNNSKLVTLKSFYIRRALRIFPIYYLLIFFLALFHGFLNARFGKAEFFNSIAYTTNFHYFIIKDWGGIVAHFWSLAVEEQFYLFWPFIILFVNRKYLIHAIILFILIGITSQCLIKDQEFGYLPTYTCFDSFGLGALLAWVIMFKPHLLSRVYNTLSVASILCFIILLTQINYGRWPYFPQRTIHSTIALWMITYVVMNKGKSRFSFSAFLDNRVLFFLGKISYGLYLYHLPLVWFALTLSPLINRYLPFHFVKQHHNYVLLFVEACLLILISWLSWRFIEKPILRLKKYFDYQPSPGIGKIKGEELSTPRIAATNH